MLSARKFNENPTFRHVKKRTLVTTSLCYCGATSFCILLLLKLTMKSIVLSAWILLLLGTRPWAQQNFCVPVTQNHCCGYGITNLNLGGIQNNSADGSAGYENFTTLEIILNEGLPYTVSVTTGGAEPHDLRIWLDANNDSIFSHPQELVFESLSSVNPQGELSLPLSVLPNTALRLRVMADYAGSNPLPCANPLFGQAEDYALRLIPAAEIPSSSFYAADTSTCNGFTEFFWNGTGSPVFFAWDFGDGNFSSEQNPMHTYTQNGSYTVSLVTGNSAGSDTLTREDYIHVLLSESCDTFELPVNGTSNILYSYNFLLTDDGGNANYSDNASGSISISPPGAERVCIRFLEFHTETGFDFLRLYDGPTSASPLIGEYSGTQIPQEVCSSGPALCVKLNSDDIVNYRGFLAQVNTLLSVENTLTESVRVFPNPFTDYISLVYGEGNEKINGIELLSNEGRRVYAHSNDPQFPDRIDTQALSAGIYFLRITTASGNYVIKLVRVP